MNDPHVNALHYAAETGSPNISYSNPAPLEYRNELGEFNLRDGELIVRPAEHFASEQDACEAFDPFLRSWQVLADLQYGPGMLRFRFVRADVIDRDPMRPGTSQTFRPTVTRALSVACKATLQATHNRYPDPPTGFRTTSDVELAYRRWLAFKGGREPLQAMSYFVLTVLERRAGSRKDASRTYSISHAVLSKIAELSSQRGDELSARKVSQTGEFEKLTAAERHWLEQATRKVVQRLGEYAGGTPMRHVTMQDLPSV